MKFICLCIWVCFAATGCGKSRALSLGASPPHAEPATASDIEVQESLMPVAATPGLYHFSLKWRGAEKYSDVQVLKRTENLDPAEVAQAFSAATFLDPDLKSGQLVEYRITGRWEGGLYLLYQNQFQVPEDSVISGEKVFSASYRMPRGRLFLEKGAVLRTLGKDIKIEVDTLIAAEGATIQTLPQGEAPAGVVGLSGGQLWLRARSLQGQLRILSQGQTGGRGTDGAPGAPGRRGSDGRDGDHRCDLSGPNFGPTAGGNGDIGTGGSAGAPGASGGASATIKVEILQGVPGQITIEPLPGPGGAGGQGGEGGPGGEGGRGGRGNGRRVECQDQAPGARGPQGPRGASGRSGSTGQIAADCIIESGKTRGRCEKLSDLFFQNF